jgi:radical SAM superfamily enzyme YgiQ (UPF0313 family)
MFSSNVQLKGICAMKVKKVLLVYPPTSRSNVTLDFGQLLEPLALEYIAAAMPEQEVRILDMRIDHDLMKQVDAFQPDMVGFTGFSCHVNTVLHLARLVKSSHPNIIMVVGGHHATVRPIDFDIPEFDYIVSGEGTSVIREMFDPGKSPADILGLGYLVGGQRVFNPVRPHPSLDELPFPRRELVRSNAGRYLLNWHYDVATIRTSLGCPFRCSFCSLWKLTEGRYLQRDTELVIREMTGIAAQTLFYADDESMLDYKGMMNLARRIKEEGIKKTHYLWARADTVVNHPDLFAAWKEVGLEGVFLGYESYSDKELSQYDKKITIEIQEKATRILQKAGILIEANFIVSTDYQKDDFIGLKKYVRRENLWKASYGILTPWPGCRLYDEKYDEALIKDWDYYDAGHAVFKTKLPLSEFYRLFRWLDSTSMPLKYKVWTVIKEPWNKIIPKRWAIARYRLKQAFNYQQQKKTVINVH